MPSQIASLSSHKIKHIGMNKTSICNFIVDKDDLFDHRGALVQRPSRSGVGRMTDPEVLANGGGRSLTSACIKSLDFREGGRWRTAW